MTVLKQLYSYNHVSIIRAVANHFTGLENELNTWQCLTQSRMLIGMIYYLACAKTNSSCDWLCDQMLVAHWSKTALLVVNQIKMLHRCKAQYKARKEWCLLLWMHLNRKWSSENTEWKSCCTITSHFGLWT